MSDSVNSELALPAPCSGSLMPLQAVLYKQQSDRNSSAGAARRMRQEGSAASAAGHAPRRRSRRATEINSERLLNWQGRKACCRMQRLLRSEKPSLKTHQQDQRSGAVPGWGHNSKTQQRKSQSNKVIMRVSNRHLSLPAPRPHHSPLQSCRRPPSCCCLPAAAATAGRVGQTRAGQ